MQSRRGRLLLGQMYMMIAPRTLAADSKGHASLTKPPASVRAYLKAATTLAAFVSGSNAIAKSDAARLALIRRLLLLLLLLALQYNNQIPDA